MVPLLLAFTMWGECPKIFSSGENLKHLYIHTDGKFKGEWFGGKYDDKVIVKLRVAELEKELKQLKLELVAA